jgi:hypothetical protein
MKDKVVPGLKYEPCHEDVLRNGGIAPRKINLRKRWRRVISFGRRCIPVWKEAPVLDRRMSGPQRRSGCCGEEKNL